MRVIFLGCFYPSDREDEIRRNSKFGLDNAANNLQWAILEGLDYYFPHLEVITQPAIGTYPLKYKKVYFKGSCFSHKTGATDFSTGFINIPLVKHLSKYWTLHKKLKEITGSDGELVIIVYAIHSPFLKALVNLRKKNKRIKLIQIVPDLPRFMSGSVNPIYRFLKAIDSFYIECYLKKIDGFVLLSEGMVGELKVGERPWIRMEGIYCREKSEGTLIKEKYKTILYTGSINERYGIRNLLKAFNLIDDENYRLWIRGNGSLKGHLIRSMKSDQRIKYFEEMPRKELLELEKRATVLINPVPPTETFTKYFFPSKIIEYMASGTPCIMHRLPGIPTEYYDYVFVAEQEDVSGLKERILEVCNKDQSVLNEFGAKASKYINETKNPITQVEKIADLISRI